jgi:hypothetical protein
MKIVWIILLILFGLILFGTAGPAIISPPTTTNVMVEINGNPGVILDVSTYRHDAEGWTPDVEHLQAAEDAVLVAPPGPRVPEIEGYRQYVGIVEDGDRKIIINSMCMEIDGWTEKYIQIEDGGSCFWEAQYNVDTGELESLIVNGEA